MPGSMPATSQLEWLISMTAMIVLFWSRATRDLLKSFGCGIAGTPSIRCSDEVAIPRRPPHSVSRSRPPLFLSEPVHPGAADRRVEPFHSRLGRRPASAYGLLRLPSFREAVVMANAIRLLIKNGTLIDGSSGDPVPNRLLVVEGNRITLVGETDGSMQELARSYNVSRATISRLTP